MSQIDTYDYVQAPEGAESLKYGDTKQQAKFELGVCMAVYKWEELTTAVDNQWGGATSADKRDWISGIVIELFEDKVVDIQAIEETLLYAMVDEFDTEIDNDSALQIASLIMKFYKDAGLQKYDQIDELYAKWQAKQNLRSEGQKVVIETDPNNPSDSEDEDEDDENIDSPVTQTVDDSAMDIDEPPALVVDEDGFELVQKKGRRRR